MLSSFVGGTVLGVGVIAKDKSMRSTEGYKNKIQEGSLHGDRCYYFGSSVPRRREQAWECTEGERHGDSVGASFRHQSPDMGMWWVCEETTET